MIIEEDKINCFRIYAGELYFTLASSAGPYTLITWPEKLLFRLIMPEGYMFDGSMKELGSCYAFIESQDDGLFKWVYDCLNWYIDTEERMERVWAKEKVVLDGCEYTYEYCNGSDEIILTQPARVIIGYRNTLADYFPEMMAYHHGHLFMALANTVFEHRDVPVDGDGAARQLPLTFIPQIHRIDGYCFGIAYDAATDLLYLNLPPKGTQTHAALLLAQLPELEVLHGGRLLQCITAFVRKQKEKEMPLGKYRP
jgi:hypothetical protein